MSTLASTVMRKNWPISLSQDLRTAFTHALIFWRWRNFPRWASQIKCLCAAETLAWLGGWPNIGALNTASMLLPDPRQDVNLGLPLSRRVLFSTEPTTFWASLSNLHEPNAYCLSHFHVPLGLPLKNENQMLIVFLVFFTYPQDSPQTP